MAIGGGVPTNVLKRSANQFIYAEVADAINQWKFGADLILIYDGFYFQSEYSAIKLNRKTAVHNYVSDGIYAQAGLLLLGDKKYNYDNIQGWVPNPNPKNLELLLRYNITDLNDRDAAVMGGKLKDLTIGANYFINKYVAVRLNFTHAKVDGNGHYGVAEKFNYIQGRFQLNF